jgi:hypothetical protein
MFMSLVSRSRAPVLQRVFTAESGIFYRAMRSAGKPALMLASRRNTTAFAGFLRRLFEFSEATTRRQILPHVLALLTPPLTRRPRGVSVAAWPKPQPDLAAFWPVTKVILNLGHDITDQFEGTRPERVKQQLWDNQAAYFMKVKFVGWVISGLQQAFGRVKMCRSGTSRQRVRYWSRLRD